MPEQIWVITEKEADVLHLMPLRAQLLYVMVFRRYMDKDTGMCGGSKKRITPGVISANLEVKPDVGSKEKPWKPGEDECRAMVKMLERAGLIVKQPKKKRTDYAVYYLPLAYTVKNRLEEEHRRNPEGATPKGERPSSQVKSGAAAKRTPKGTPKQKQQKKTRNPDPQGSSINTTNVVLKRAGETRYRFEGSKIKLNQEHYNEIVDKYPNLDIDSELAQLDLELAETKSWWQPMNSKLYYRNKNAQEKIHGQNSSNQRNRSEARKQALDEQFRSRQQSTRDRAEKEVYGTATRVD